MRFFPHLPRLHIGHHIFHGLLLVLILGFSAAFLFFLPPRYSPVAPLTLDSAAGPFAGAKLAAFREDHNACARAVALSRLKTTPVPDKTEGSFCALRNVLEIRQSFYPYSQDLKVSCPLAAGLYLWEREVVAPAAAKHLDSAVVRIEMFGAYSCRRMYGAKEGRVSEHATANAIDISGFKLASGRTILVDKVWNAKTDEAAFLHEVRDRGCSLFQTVLSPDYNEAHHNHLHFDMGPSKFCR